MKKFIVVAIFVVILILFLVIKTKEHFYPHIDYKSYCSECGTKNNIDCGDCVNCVKCMTPSGAITCVPGDMNGPYFTSNCVDWKYGNNYPIVGFSYLDWFKPYWRYGNSRPYHNPVRNLRRSGSRSGYRSGRGKIRH